MFAETEWDYRAPTLAEQVDDLNRNWDGPRCPHGTPLNAPGPDLICGQCESEAAEEQYFFEMLEALDRGEPYFFPIGPDRTDAWFGPQDRETRLGLLIRGGPNVPSDSDVPF